MQVTESIKQQALEERLRLQAEVQKQIQLQQQQQQQQHQQQQQQQQQQLLLQQEKLQLQQQSYELRSLGETIVEKPLERDSAHKSPRRYLIHDEPVPIAGAAASALLATESIKSADESSGTEEPLVRSRRLFGLLDLQSTNGTSSPSDMMQLLNLSQELQTLATSARETWQKTVKEFRLSMPIFVPSPSMDTKTLFRTIALRWVRLGLLLLDASSNQSEGT